MRQSIVAGGIFAATGFLAWSGCGASSAWAQDTEVAPAIAMVQPFDPERFDLSGMADLQFDSNAPGFAEIAPALSAVSYWYFTKGAKRAESSVVRLRVDRVGAIKACEPAEDAPPPVKAMCPLLVREGTVRIDAKVDVSFNLGMLDVGVAARATADVERPIKFVSQADGAKFVVIASADGTCLGLGPSVPETGEIVCKAWRAAGMPGGEARENATLAEVTVASKRGTVPQYEVGAIPFPATRGQIYLAESMSAPGPQLNVADGTLDAHPGYPTPAARYEMEGKVVVWLGIDRQGNPKNCRPVYSQDGAWLATATCAELIRTSKFKFSDNAPRYEGLRYRGVPVVWTLR